MSIKEVEGLTINDVSEELERAGAEIIHKNLTGMHFCVANHTHIIILTAGDLILTSNGLSINFDNIEFKSTLEKYIKFTWAECTVCTINL